MKITIYIVCETVHYCEYHHIFKRENSDTTIILCKSCHLKLEKMQLHKWSPNESFESFFTLFNKADQYEKLFLLKMVKLCIIALDTLEEKELTRNIQIQTKPIIVKTNEKKLTLVK